MNEVDTFLAHYGVLGMKWGVRRSIAGSKRQEWTKSPLTVGQDIRMQVAINKATMQYGQAKNSQARKAAKMEVEKLKKERNERVKESSKFTKDMYKKVGNPKKLTSIKDDKGKISYINKKGQAIKSFEVIGAEQYVSDRSLVRVRALSSTVAIAAGAMFVSELLKR